MKVKFTPPYNNAYLLDLDDAVTITKILVNAEIFDGYGDTERLKVNDQDCVISSCSEKKIKTIRRRQVLESK